MKQIHNGHLGIEKCMLKARESVFWPGISNDIHEAVEKCGICQVSSKAAKPVGNVSDRLVLLEQSGLFSGWRLLQQVLDHQETSKQFHTCSDQGIRTNLH